MKATRLPPGSARSGRSLGVSHMFKHYLNPVEWWDDLAYGHLSDDLTPLALTERLPADAESIWTARPAYPRSVQQRWRRWCDAYSGSYARLVDETLERLDSPETDSRWRRVPRTIPGTWSERILAVLIDEDTGIGLHLVSEDGEWRVYSAYRTTAPNVRVAIGTPRDPVAVAARRKMFKQRARRRQGRNQRSYAAWNAS